jgi:hypothetical protein
LPAVLTIAAVALIVGLFGLALFDFAQAREKTGSRSRIVIAMINALPDRDGDVPFTAAPDAPAVSAASNTTADVEKILQQWARLWSQRDAQGFLKLYDPSFPDFERYAQTRTRRMNAAKDISVELQGLTLEPAGPHVVVARFTQHYRSDAYQDSVTKELTFKRTGNSYRIVAEKTVK